MENIGKITVDQQLTALRAARREDEIFNDGGGWKAKNKVHRSEREYTRKPKHKKRFDY